MEGPTTQEREGFHELVYSPLMEGQIVSDYEILEKESSGAYADVFWAVCLNTGEDRAIKAPNDCTIHEDPEILDREAGLLLTLEHKNIVKGFEPFKHNGYIHIPMEFLSFTWKNYISPGNGALRKLASELAEGLQYLHEKNIVHCDLNPSNCMAAGSPDGLVMKIIDFGLANESDTPDKLILGTTGFIPPEIYHEGKITTALDMYAYGKTLAYLILRINKIPRGVIRKMLEKETRDAIANIILHRSKAEEGLVEIAYDCMDENYQSRPSAGDVLERIARIGLN